MDVDDARKDAGNEDDETRKARTIKANTPPMTDNRRNRWCGESEVLAGMIPSSDFPKAKNYSQSARHEFLIARLIMSQQRYGYSMEQPRH